MSTKVLHQADVGGAAAQRQQPLSYHQCLPSRIAMLRHFVVVPGMRLLKDSGEIKMNRFLAHRLIGARHLIQSELAGEPVVVIPTGAKTGDVREISEAAFVERELRKDLRDELHRLTFVPDEWARNTLENLTNARQIIETRIDLRSPACIHLVSNDWHLRFFAAAPFVFSDSRFWIVAHRVRGGEGSDEKAGAEYSGLAAMLMAVVQAGDYMRAPALYDSIRQRAVA